MPDRVRRGGRRLSLRRCALVFIGVIVTAALPAYAGQGTQDQVPDLAQYVDPMVGTAAPGFVVPGAATPFGMTQVSPDTGGPFAYSGYLYTDPQINGFSFAHLSGPGAKKGGDIPLTPTVGPVTSSNYQANASSYDHASERADPGYYKVRLDSYGVDAEMSAAAHSGLQHYTFRPAPQANVLFDVSRSVEGVHAGSFQVIDDHTVRGWATGRYTVYFEAQFDRPFLSYGSWRGSALTPGSRVATGSGAGGWVSFDTLSRRDVSVRVGISFVDVAGAAGNLAAEVPGFDVAGMHAAARSAWNHELAKVRVEGGSALDLTTFYTALYHALLHPNVFSDVDGRYIGFDGTVRPAIGRLQTQQKGVVTTQHKS